LVWSARLDLRSRERHPLYLAAAVPVGSVRAPGQVLWLAAVRLVLELAHLRADVLAKALAIAEVLAYGADWDTMLSRPTHPEIAARVGCSLRTVARYRLMLEEAGLMGIVTPGRTRDPVAPQDGPLAQAYILTIPEALLAQLQPAPRPLVLVDTPPTTTTPTPTPAAGDGDATGDRERGQDHQGDPEPTTQAAGPGPGTGPDGAASEDADHRSDAPPGPQPAPLVPGPGALTRPEGPVDELVTPSLGIFSDFKNPRTRVRRVCGGAARGEFDDQFWPGRGGAAGAEVIWPTTVRPATRTERHLAAAEARRVDPVLRRVSTVHVAALAREWHLAGWTIADLRWALEHRPDGSSLPHSMVAADVRHVPGWVRHRLTPWRTDPGDPASPPRLSRSQHAAAVHAAEVAVRAAAVAADQAATAAAVPAAAAAGDWTTARAALAARTAAAPEARHRPPTDVPARRTGGPPRRPHAAPVTNARVVPAVPRPVDQTADPRLAACRAAVRATLRPRA
jgi:hypothetical protein